MKLPNELLLLIYNLSDPETCIKLNKIFKWNFLIANPLQNKFKPKVFKLYDNYFMINYIKGH